MSIRTALIFILLSVLYFAVRLCNLTIIPIENDEASFIYVARLVKEDFAANWDLSYKHWVMSMPPFFVWWAAFWLNFIKDPLVAGRVASVTGGYLTLIGVFWAARKLFSLPVALIATVLLIFSPIHMDSDRKAVVDSLMGGWFALFFAALISLARSPRWLWAIFGSLFLGFSSWTKQTGMLGFAALPLAFLFIPWKSLKVWDKKVGFSKVSNLVILLTALAAFAYFLISLQNISPKAAVLTSRAASALSTSGGKSILDDPFVNAVVNIPNTLEILWKYYSLSALALFLAGFSLALIKKNEPALALAAAFFWFLAPIILLGLPYGSKYVYYTTVPFLISLAWYCYQLPLWLKKRLSAPLKIWQTALFLVVLTPMLLAVRMFLFAPIDPNMYHVDNRYYFDGSGYGIPEVVREIRRVKTQNPTKKIAVLAEGISGHLWHTLSIYLWDETNISIYPVERSLNFLKEPERIADYLENTARKLKARLKGDTIVLLATNNNLPDGLTADGFAKLAAFAKPAPPQPNFWRDLQIVDYDSYKGFHVDLYEVK